MNATLNEVTGALRTSQPSAQPSSSLANAARAAAVTFAPPAAVDALLVASTATTLVSVVAPSTRSAGPWRLLAAVGSVVPWAYLLLARPRVLTWGATDEEVGQPLPGDDIVPQPAWA